MLVKATKYLIPYVAQMPPKQTTLATKSFFQAHFTDEEATKGLVLLEFSIFSQTHVTTYGWKEHQAKFKAIFFLAHQIMGIPGSQIKTKGIFSMVGVLCALHMCKLGMENLDAMVLIYKN